MDFSRDQKAELLPCPVERRRLYTIGTRVHGPRIKKPSSWEYFRRKTLGSICGPFVGASLLAKATAAVKKNLSPERFG
jgi:hypothetical protein